MIRDTSQQDSVMTQKKGLTVKTLMWLAVIVLLAVVGWRAIDSWLTNDVSVAKEQLKLATVERGELLRDIVSTGKIVAANAPVIYSPEEGLVTMSVKPGDMVKAGQEVALIASPQLMARLSQQKTLVQQLTSAFNREKLSARRKQLELQQKLELAKVDLAAAEREARRADTSIARQLISQIDFEQAQDDLAKAKLRTHHAEQEAFLSKDTLAFEVENKELELKAQQQVLAELQRKVDELTVLSPVAGIVGNWLVEQKAKVGTNQSLMMIVDLSAYEAELQVPESYADELGLGMLVEISVAGKQLVGQLSSISPEVINNKVTTRVRMPTDEGTALRQNQRVSARIILEQKDDVLMVRRGQFYQSGAGKVGYQIKDGVAQRIALQSGATSMSHIEILNGVKEGDTLVISSLDVFDNKDRVLLY
ncbi:RND transporter MFP subunit [Thalassotalea insulae]|uniref:RND transporter MFP subunit n=1 Tax=Thalassotalea insulae TaxID=2056778 RepID=A0ABQ6GY14_9GAMM|nr:efflux RND transporter periplasmic adaptor subunit [Thalassotalea insulae]GLX79487.1 RND transporter MFP subunit [Thalassotalea insulae]